MAIFKRKTQQSSPKISENDEDMIYEKGFTQGNLNTKVKADSLMCGEYCHYKGCEVQNTETKKMFARKSAPPSRSLTPSIDSANKANPAMNQLLKQSITQIAKPKKVEKYQNISQVQ